MTSLEIRTHLTRGRFAGPLLVTSAMGSAVGLVAIRDPHVPGNWPGCPFYVLTGLYCPGCGSMRAVWDIAHLDLGAAVASNVLAVGAGVLLLLSLLAWWLRVISTDPLDSSAEFAARIDVLNRWNTARVFAVVVPLFWFARNLPWFSFLAP